MNRAANEMGIAPRAKGAAAVGAALAALMVAMFWWTGGWMANRFEHAGGYYSHGWLVPIVVGFLLWREREALEACPRREWLPGLIVLGSALLLQLLATLLQVGFLSGLALMGVLAGLELTLLGPEFFRLTLFPFAFLAFMIPAPEWVIDTISFRMKLLSAGVATNVSDALGLVAVREGSTIHIPGGNLVVDDVCSGLKYLIALMAFSALYARLSSVRTWQKWALFLLSIPISFLANVGRVTLMVMVGYHWGVAAVERWYFHDLFGFVLFVVAFVCLFAVESLMLTGPGWLGGGKGKAAGAAEAGGAAPARQAPYRAGKLAAGILCAMGVAAALTLYVSWQRQVRPASDVLAGIPKVVGDWRGTDQTLDARVYEILGTRDVLSRSYVNSKGERVSFLIVLAQETRSRTHPPEQCLSGEGYAIVGASDRELKIGGQAIPIREIQLTWRRGARLSWHFYKSGNHLSTSYWAHQAGLALRKLRDPSAADVLIRAEADAELNSPAGGRRVLTEFFGAMAPFVLSKLP